MRKKFDMRKLYLPLFCSISLFTLISSARAEDVHGGYAGSDSCADCHEDRSDEFAKSIHGHKQDKRSPAAKLGCESCHGPRAEHVRKMEGKVPGDNLKTHVDTGVCMECHDRGKLTLWPGSKHERRDVSCFDCHKVHGKNENLLSAKNEIEVCSTCHKDIRAQLLLSSHHPIREGKVDCSDCHNPHGAVAEKMIAANTVNDKCWECHADLRGPFLWEHAPVVEDCTNCHTAHGSSHTPLLNARTPFLCQQCHSEARHPGTLYALPTGSGGNVYSNLNNRAYYRNCLNCHSRIHGSNHPSGSSLLR